MKNIILIFLLSLSSIHLFAQCNTEENHPEGRDNALELTVYMDFIKIKDYAGALPKWTELYECCPAAFKGKVLSDGDKIYKGLFKNTDDEAEKEIYARKRIEIIEQKIECFGYIKKRKRSGLYYAGYWHYNIAKIYTYDLKEYENANKHYEKAIELDSTYIDNRMIRDYAFNTVQLYKAKKVTLEKYRAIYKILIWIAEQKEWTPKQIEENIEQFFSRVDVAPYDCDDMVERLRADYEAHRCDDDYIVSVIFKKLRRAGCTADHPFVQKVQSSLNTIDDCSEGEVFSVDYIDIGNRYLRNGCTDEAKLYYQKGIDEKGIEKGKRFYAAMRLGKLYHKDEEWQKALEIFEFAMILNENSGEPYISIGLLYLSANKTCEGVERQLIARVAIDYFRKAKAFEDTKEEATNKVAIYSTYLPDTFGWLPSKKAEEREVGCVLKKKTFIHTK